jgi:hypothetical protein
MCRAGSRPRSRAAIRVCIRLARTFGARFASQMVVSSHGAAVCWGDWMGECAMRAEMIAELGGSVIITVITGLYTAGGLALAGYFFLAFHPSLNALGTISLLFGVVNLPLFIIWSRETVHEITSPTDFP